MSGTHTLVEDGEGEGVAPTLSRRAATGSLVLPGRRVTRDGRVVDYVSFSQDVGSPQGLLLVQGSSVSYRGSGVSFLPR